MSCTPEIGCIGRHKFMSYVTVLSKGGKPKISESIMNYKVVYVFTDRLVFYASTDAGNASLEAEAPVSLIEQESKIERVINYGDIILDCGKFKNKLCHAQEYAGIDQIESYIQVKKTATQVPESLCILIPFFENGFKKMHDKIAYICGCSIKELYGIIGFKNFMSRNIEFYQLNNSLDRYNGFNGLLHKQLNFVINKGGKAATVVAKLYNQGIIYSVKDTGLFHSYYSFHDLRKSGFGAYKVKDGMAKGKVPVEWNKGLPKPNPECCIYFKGEIHQMSACLATDSGSIESAEDICKIKIDRLYGEIRISLRGVAYSEAYYEIQSNKVKAKDCKSKEYAVFKYRLIKSTEYAVENDCKMVINYLNIESNDRKLEWCKKNYFDEISLEKRLMSLNNNGVHDSIENCVYNNNGSLFDEAKFDELVKKAQILPSSFMELTNSESEVDDYDDDDEVVEKKSQKNKLRKSLRKQVDTEDEENTEEVNLLEKNMMMKKKKKDKRDVIFNKPKNDKTTADKEKTQIFRNMQMEKLQSRKTFTQSNRENIDEKFSHGKASMGKENADEFVSFLGYLRDASFKASKLIAKKEGQQLSKLLREEPASKKKGLTATDD